MLSVSVINKSHHALPSYQTEGAAGMDLRANLSESVALKPLERKLVPTGLFLQIPLGYEVQVRPRSGLAIKKGLTLINTPGTIDSDYRGELMIAIVNLSNEVNIIEDGDRIAQMVVAKHETIVWEIVEELSDSARGIAGFGHTGIK